MSQNNYIDFIKNTTIARDFKKQPNILDTSVYTTLKSYSLAMTIPNTKLSFSNLMNQNMTRVFDMDLSLNNCANIQECINTNQRPNRVLQPVSLPRPTFRMNKIYTPKCCAFTNGQVTRKCICSKKTCKYGTDYCGSTKPGGISGHSNIGP